MPPDQTAQDQEEIQVKNQNRHKLSQHIKEAALWQTTHKIYIENAKKEQAESFQR